MLKKSASFVGVPIALSRAMGPARRDSTYTSPVACLRATGPRYASPPPSLRPHWTAFLNILRAVLCASGPSGLLVPTGVETGCLDLLSNPLLLSARGVEQSGSSLGSILKGQQLQRRLYADPALGCAEGNSCATTCQIRGSRWRGNPEPSPESLIARGKGVET